MDKFVKEIIEQCFSKYKVSKAAIQTATDEIVRLFHSRPQVKKYGAAVMTEEASMAADKKCKDAREKPQIL